ncbi:MAG: hypothetical protein RSD69_03185 [Bacilli bacterium]
MKKTKKVNRGVVLLMTIMSISMATLLCTSLSSLLVSKIREQAVINNKHQEQNKLKTYSEFLTYYFIKNEVINRNSTYAKSTYLDKGIITAEECEVIHDIFGPTVTKENEYVPLLAWYKRTTPVDVNKHPDYRGSAKQIENSLGAFGLDKPKIELKYRGTLKYYELDIMVDYTDFGSPENFYKMSIKERGK